MIKLIEKFDIAGYARISVDDELDRDNVSIENQKAIIEDFIKHKFPDSTLTFYEDRDRSGYTFEQREGYQKMRRGLMSHKYDILVVKDFSRFSRRNSRGLVELEDLRDAGVRIISIGDGIDFPNDDDWLKIQFQFLINEMPVTDTSKKVRNVIKRRQADGQWICAAPYGYMVNKRKEFEIVPTEADIVRRIFELYNNEGWGYKKIANYLTDQGIPTPRMSEQMRKEAAGETCRREIKAAWAIVTVQGILDNDFYIGIQRRKGHIINISSVWGNVGASMEVAYSASKGALNSMTKALAKEVAPSNVQVNAIACGLIDTDMNACFCEEDLENVIAEIPADRMGRPEEVAKLCLQLVDAPGYLMGQVINLDGGWI